MAGYAHTIKETLEKYARERGISTFVETGTFKGNTANVAAQVFDRVYTIELSPELFAEASHNSNNTNVTFLNGESPEILKKLLPSLKNDVVFFLDAHWAGYLSARSAKETPLLDELRVIRARTGYSDIIIVDDISFCDKKGKFNMPIGSQYFPEGGLFEWDWSGIHKQEIIDMFPDKQRIEKDDRLIFF